MYDKFIILYFTVQDAFLADYNDPEVILVLAHILNEFLSFAKGQIQTKVYREILSFKI